MQPETLINSIGNILPDFQKKFLSKIHIESLPESVRNVVRENDIQVCMWDNKNIETSYTGSTFFTLVKPQNNGNEDLDDSGYENKERCSKGFYKEVVENIQAKYDYTSFSKYVFEKRLYYIDTHDFTSDYSVIWIVKFKSVPELRDRYVWQILLDALAEHVQSINDILYPDTFKMPDFDFMDFYQKYVFRQNTFLPDSAVIKKIAFLAYEKRQNNASIYFVSKEQLDEIVKREKMVKISENSLPKEGIINEENSVFVRKLLETCSSSTRCLLCVKMDGTNQIYGILHHGTNLNTMQEVFSLKFEGNGNWQLTYDDNPILIYHAGTYLIDKDMKTADFTQKLSVIQELKIRNKEGLFVKILNKLDSLCHGGLMIIADDAEKEADFLCEHACRGMKIEPLDLSDDDNLTLFYGLSSIDGATLVDFNGYCYGFGVILDGNAQVKGDMGNGARYNSAANYIFGKQRYAVIISEDKEKEITVLCPDKLNGIPINSRKKI